MYDLQKRFPAFHAHRIILPGLYQKQRAGIPLLLQMVEQMKHGFMLVSCYDVEVIIPHLPITQNDRESTASDLNQKVVGIRSRIYQNTGHTFRQQGRQCMLFFLQVVRRIGNQQCITPLVQEFAGSIDQCRGKRRGDISYQKTN